MFFKFHDMQIQDDECGARMALISSFKLSGNIDSIELRIVFCLCLLLVLHILLLL